MEAKIPSLFERALQLPEVISLAERLEQGGALSFHGIAEAAKPFAMMVVTLAVNRPICVLASSVKQQELFHSELSVFASQVSLGKATRQGRPSHRKARAVPKTNITSPPLKICSFPELEMAPAVNRLPDLEILSEMISTLLALRSHHSPLSVGQNSSNLFGRPPHSPPLGERNHPGKGGQGGAGGGSDSFALHAAPWILVTTEKAALQSLPDPRILEATIRRVHVGDRIETETLMAELVEFGYENQAEGAAGGGAVVAGRGQFVRRGGILDLFPFQEDFPLRLEFNGNEIESIRTFDLAKQTSVQTLSEAMWVGLDLSSIGKGTARLSDYLEGKYLIWREPMAVGEPVMVGKDEGGKMKDEKARWGRECGGQRTEDGTGNVKCGTREGMINHAPTPIKNTRKKFAPNDDVGAQFIVPKNYKIQEVSSQGDPSLEIFGHDFFAAPLGDPVLQEQRLELLLRHWRDWSTAGWRIFVFCNNEGEEQRLREMLAQRGGDQKVAWFQGPLLHGFWWPKAGLVVLSDAEIFGRYQTLSMARAQQRVARARIQREPLDFSRFVEGDRVVHAQYGISRFLGVREVEVEGRPQEVLTLEYAHGALLHVPTEQAHLVGRYVGVGRRSAELDELGGSRWEKATIRAQRAVMDYAAQLLRVQAERGEFSGFAFAPDNEWQREFEEAFVYEETADQVTAVTDTKEDMESNRPMDRLICGDVGFGKTEVAIRAAFKAVMNGKQVAVLVPTTVLAQQHEQTFRERMADYPVRIDLLSRFRSRKEQRQTLAALREGRVDILIGTHRLLQSDVVFRDLGLVVVDEEQRFGVKHKERFKQIFKLVDMLTLSATPIPRTLYLALVNARDMSQIETPPINRLPIETVIAAYDERLIRSAIQRELARGGQVYFLHNRVQSIMRVRDRVRDLVPEARVEIAHGQMDEDELEGVMIRFVSGNIDVLVSTTIIESGLDIPRANTILIDRADRFGLADLYQLRGRIGRSQMKAYAYLLLPRHLMLEPEAPKGAGPAEASGVARVGEARASATLSARRRVSSIQQYSQLGAGFKVAMRDLELRGAGNILGTEQSGHATAIGFELYCQLLKQTVARLKGEKPAPRAEVHVRLDFLPMSEDHAQDGLGAFIPRSYISESRLRIGAYRRLAEVSQKDELQLLLVEWKDRFGRLPAPVVCLLDLVRVRLAAAAAGISSVEVEEGKVMLRRGGSLILIGSRLPRLTSALPGERLNEILGLIPKLGTRITP